jgi:predicted Zn-dependent protease
MTSLKTAAIVVLPVVLLAFSLPAADVSHGIHLYEQKKYAEAESALREAVAAEPDNADANHYLGLALLETKKYKEAEGAFGKAAEARPDARVGLAQAYMMQDKLDEATGELDKAAEDSSENPAFHRTRGMILLKRDRFADASQSLARALELDPKDPYANYYFGMASSRLRRTDLMIKHFQLFLELAPNAPEAPKVRSLLRSL